MYFKFKKKKIKINNPFHNHLILFLIQSCFSFAYSLLESACNKMSRVFYTYGKFCASRPWEGKFFILCLHFH